MPEISPSRYLVQAGWDDVPHIDEATKTELLASYLPHERDARSKGEPSLGSGAIYPIGLDEILVKPFAIPEFWPRAYALDVGWKRTAALWGAWDPSTWSLYLTAEYYASQAVPAIHAAAIRARGEWIRGVVDPAARGRGQSDGAQMIQLYRDAGLDLTPADNSVDAGIHDVWQMLAMGRLKAFSTLSNWQAEIRLYRRDERGRIVKDFDHLMDTMRYLVRSGRRVARTRPVDRADTTAALPIGDSHAGY